MEITPIAYFRSPIDGKFGIPRQAGLAPELRGEILIEPEFNVPEAFRGLEGFSHIWLIWGFSMNEDRHFRPTVRPPRLGGNERVGVFASRSPFRPNPIGLSSVKLEAIHNGTLYVSGADLADGTPIFDIKPYIPYTDSHPDANDGFVGFHAWNTLDVSFPDDPDFMTSFSRDELQALREILEQDPRPQYQDNPDRVYGLNFSGKDIHFRVEGSSLKVLP